MTLAQYPTLSLDKIVCYFEFWKNLFHKSGEKIEDEFYVGITNDVKANLKRHNITAYIFACNVGTSERACELEALLHEKLGFFIGVKGCESAGRGASEDSTVVYLARRNQPGFVD